MGWKSTLAPLQSSSLTRSSFVFFPVSTAHLQSILKDLRCHLEDEVFFHGGITGVSIATTPPKTTQVGKHVYWVLFSSIQMAVPPFACQFAPGKSSTSLPPRMYVLTYVEYRCPSWQSAGSGRWGGIITSHEYSARCFPVPCERYMQNLCQYLKSVLQYFSWFCYAVHLVLFSELPAHSNAIFDISWLPGGEQLVRTCIIGTTCTTILCVQ